MAVVTTPFGGQIIRLSGGTRRSSVGSIGRRSGGAADEPRTLGGVIPPPRSPFVFPEGSRNQRTGFQTPSGAPPYFRMSGSGAIMRRGQLRQDR